jgi:hypothetical protein
VFRALSVAQAARHFVGAAGAQAAELEVGVVRDDGDRAFRVLSVTEVETFLNAITERD